MSGPRALHSLRHEPQSTPLKFEEPVRLWPITAPPFSCVRKGEVSYAWPTRLPQGLTADSNPAGGALPVAHCLTCLVTNQ
jgi:hypothetical protein